MDINIEDILSYGVNIKGHQFTVIDLLNALLIFFITKIIIVLINKFYDRRFDQKKTSDKGRIISLKLITKYFIWTIAIVLIIQNFNYDITLLIAGSAALLVGIGLGLQQIFNDIVSGFIILFDRTIKVGDVVQIGELVGTVRDINIRTSRVETQDRVQIIVPNHKFVSENVINWSKKNPLTRFKIIIPVAYGSDVELVRKLLFESAMEHKDIEKEPQPIVEFHDFGESALIFNLMFYTKIILPMWKIRSDLRFDIEKKFKEHHVRIPIPQRDIYIHHQQENA